MLFAEQGYNMRLSFWLFFILCFSNCQEEDKDSNLAVEFINMRVEDITASSAILRFETSIPTSCEAEFGLNKDSLNETATDPTMMEDELSIDHDVLIGNLRENSEYFIRARATTSKNITYYSELLSFNTLSISIDEEDDKLLSRSEFDIVSVSSNWAGGDNNSSFGIEKAFDQNLVSEWSSDGNGDNAFVSIKLHSRRKIRGFSIRSRKMADGSSIITSIVMNIDNENIGTFETPDPDQTYRFIFTEIEGENITWKVSSSTGGNTGAKEIQLILAD